MAKVRAEWNHGHSPANGSVVVVGGKSELTMMLTKLQAAEFLGVTVRTLFALYPRGENRRTASSWAKLALSWSTTKRSYELSLQSWRQRPINQRLLKLRRMKSRLVNRLPMIVVPLYWLTCCLIPSGMYSDGDDDAIGCHAWLIVTVL